MPKSKTIFLLIGAKGSGKTYIGSLFQKYYSTPFVRVEDWLLHLNKRPSIEDTHYVKSAFSIIEDGILEIIRKKDSLVFESTGLTEYFDQMCNRLSRDHDLITIKILAKPDICLDRVRKRDHSIHIDISDNQVKKINDAVQLKKLNCKYEIENSYKTESELVNELQNIMRKEGF